MSFDERPVMIALAGLGLSGCVGALKAGVPLPVAVVYGLAAAASPVVLGLALCGVGTAVCTAREALEARRALVRRRYTPRLFTRVGEELWVVWLPGARRALGGRKKGEAYSFEPCFGDECWSDEVTPEEWAEIEEWLSHDLATEEGKLAQGRARVGVLDSSGEVVETLKSMGYREVPLVEFKRAVEQWRKFTYLRRKVRKRNRRNF